MTGTEEERSDTDAPVLLESEQRRPSAAPHSGGEQVVDVLGWEEKLGREPVRLVSDSFAAGLGLAVHDQVPKFVRGIESLTPSWEGKPGRGFSVYWARSRAIEIDVARRTRHDAGWTSGSLCGFRRSTQTSPMPVMVARNCKRSRTFVESLSDGCMVAAELI